MLHVADYYVDDAQIKYLREKGETAERRSAVMQALSTPPSCSPSIREESTFRGWRHCR